MFLCQIVFIMNSNSVYKCFKSLISSDKYRKFRIGKLKKILTGETVIAGNYVLRNDVTS